MPNRKDERTSERKDADGPRTDLAPKREPYDEGYFGTEEEEGVSGSREATEEEQKEGER